MTDAIRSYLAEGGADYLASPEYETRRRVLAAKMQAGPVSLADMATTLNVPLAVVVDLLNAWRAEREAAQETKH